ncbi:4-hydroxyphenylpyruvate dioxygenase [Leptolyngbya sp. FACHB-36]|uniref:4-hydroxyphenylpyruvate dioxygenase n=1 Tax=Leptolyngbya sp. FACHB-36 TaxID=2692808 RepID=UPI0016806EFF|nr:4-hydroxyphenylpyruvate dioxygenase [Leptolyngbya sp. FACHB-36]MBD2020953.1 4-hydroxyphenylpyruvate dioxygenase [Leptolyngbya sp. FACHB-36]
MKIDHVRFYVEDASVTREWFVHQLGFRSLASSQDAQGCFEVVSSGSVYVVLCSPLTPTGPIAGFLQQHPPGVADVAFCVADIEATVAQALRHGATLRQPLQIERQQSGCFKWATIAAWGDLTHTFVERSGITSLLPAPHPSIPFSSHRSSFIGIDHLVLNVASGELEQAVRWYEAVLGFQPQQRFDIQTSYSGLCSRVMRHPLGQVQLPINEPASPNSQIQEFLDINRGPGIQHIALETVDLVSAIAQLRCRGVSLLQVPSSYYTQLRQRSRLPLSEIDLQQVEAQEILVDWQDGDDAVLLQTFTQPIFGLPTFFFELIERQVSSANASRRAQGFGEGNFRALFEAIEREQMKRGSLARIAHHE